MRVISWIAAALAVGVYVTGPIQDPDLWWHLTVGRWIVAHNSVPTTDHWNLFAAGQPWVAYSWMSEVIFVLSDQWFGLKGLLTLKLVLASTLALSLFYTLGRVAGNWFVGALLGAFATAASFNHLTLRPQLLVWILLVWLIFACEEIVRRKKIGSFGVIIFLLMMLWANNHITTALGLATIACWCFGRISNILLGKLLAIGFLGTLLTPYYGQEWIVFLMKSGHPLDHRAIAEFGPASLFHYSTAFLVIICAVLAILMQRAAKREDLPRISLCALFILLGLTAVKFLPFAVIVIVATVASFWGRERKPERVFGEFGEGIAQLQALIARIPRDGITFVLLCTVVLNLWNLYREPLNKSVVPEAAVDFMVEKGLPAPVLNEFGQGGYLMYRYSNERGELQRLVSIDGRTNVNPPEIWQQYLKSFRGQPGWEEYLEAVKPETILWRTESPLSSIILEREEWCRIFASGSPERGYSIFVKRGYFEEHKKELGLESCLYQLGS